MQMPGALLRLRKERTCFASIKALLYLNVLLFLLCLFVGSAVAADVELAWDANTESDLAGYYVHYKTGSSGAPYDGTGANEGDSPIQVPLEDLTDQYNPNYPITGLSDTETYFFVVTAYNTDGDESDYSNEVNVLVVGVDNTAPTIQSYPNIDHDNNTIDITFSETDMQNVTDEANYRFSPSSNFATPLVDGDDITNPSGSTYRLTMASIPAYTILTLTVSNITDAAGNPVTPSSITINDNDGDDMADDWETDNGVDDLDEDPDGDGLNNLEEYNNNTNPNNSDTDGDSLPDDWEVAYGLDPNDSTGVNGSDGDFDDDGWTNYEEWVNGTDPVDDTSFPALSPPETTVDVPALNLPPSTPIIDYPYDGQVECEVPMSVTTEPFSDPDGDSHKESRWQISEQIDFSTLVLDVTTNRHLTVLPVPHTVLKPNQTYYVRVKFYDVYSEASDWSDSVEFATGFISDDLDSDGIPDVLEVDDTVDFNLDGIADNYQPETIKCILAATGSAYIGVEKISDSISEIEALEVIDPATISDIVDRPADLLFGLLSYRLRVNRPGAAALVRIYFSAGIFASDTFFKYDTINGWYEYSQHATFNDDGQSVTLELEDGGYGDSDGVANEVIVDPGGIASRSTYTVGDASLVDIGSEEECFIATVALGSPIESHVSVLMDFRDTYLVRSAFGRILVKTYNKYSPPLAHFIAKHEILKATVRLGLLPPVAFSYMALHFGITITACGVLLILVLPVFLISVYRRG